LHIHDILALNPLHIVLGLLWVLQVGLSRLYLGVHSPLDLMGGLSVGCILVSIWLYFGDLIDHFVTSQANVEILCSLLGVLLVTLHPRSNSTPSYSRAVVMVGLALGIVVGSQVHSSYKSLNDWIGLKLYSFVQWPLNYLHQSFFRSGMSPQMWQVFVRLTIGFLMLNFTFVFCFRIAFILFCALFRAPIISSILWGIHNTLQVFIFPSFEPIHPPPLKAGKRSSLETLPADPITWSKFFAAVVVAVVVTETVPSLFEVLDKEYF